MIVLEGTITEICDEGTLWSIRFQTLEGLHGVGILKDEALQPSIIENGKGKKVIVTTESYTVYQVEIDGSVVLKKPKPRFKPSKWRRDL